HIGSRAFEGCSALEKIDIPSSVASIGNLAFYGCSALKQIHLPASVTYIDSSAFSGCEQLEKLVILGHDTEISFPILKNARTGIKIRIDSRNYCIKDHIIYNNSCSRLLEFLNPNTNEDYCTTEEIVIGDKTKHIGNLAFHNLSGIKKIVIPDTVIQIGKEAFQQGDSVDEIFIRIDPAKAKIEKSAFDGINANCRIYVPVGTSYAYSHHEAFTRFKKDNIIMEEPEIP
ncbi:MAG: leucine-rich repeat domain-containing protein, partial [Bacteroidales bacterium]|nr:leucine-rich repeat domain-containing protein [Bacteroidales bacterium]